jgi:hypothetical protein
VTLPLASWPKIHRPRSRSGKLGLCASRQVVQKRLKWQVWYALPVCADPVVEALGAAALYGGGWRCDQVARVPEGPLDRHVAEWFVIIPNLICTARTACQQLIYRRLHICIELVTQAAIEGKRVHCCTCERSWAGGRTEEMELIRPQEECGCKRVHGGVAPPLICMPAATSAFMPSCPQCSLIIHGCSMDGPVRMAGVGPLAHAACARLIATSIAIRDKLPSRQADEGAYRRSLLLCQGSQSRPGTHVTCRSPDLQSRSCSNSGIHCTCDWRA